jgi:hypothetical protein
MLYVHLLMTEYHAWNLWIWPVQVIQGKHHSYATILHELRALNGE